MILSRVGFSLAIVLLAAQPASSQVRRDRWERERPRFHLPDRKTLPAVRPTAWGITTALKGPDEAKRAAALLDVWQCLLKDGRPPGQRTRFGEPDKDLYRFGLTTEVLAPALVPCLSSTDRNVRAMTLDVFAALSSGGESATADLVPLVSSARAEVRWAALDALVSIQASPPVLLPLLLKCVKDPDETVRKLSQDAAEAVFRQNADDVEDDRRDRERRFGEIPRERLDFAFTLGLLRPLLADQSSRVQLTALHCLSELEERGLPLRSALVPLLGEAQDADVRSTAAQILLRLDPEAHDAPAEAARALIGQLGVSEPDILLETHDEQLPLDGFAGARKARLRTALGAGLARPLMAIIERHDQERMYLAIRGLEEMGPQAQPAAPVLEKLVDKDTQYWDEAACALASVDRKRRQYLPKLRGMYEENDGWPRFVFAFALSYYGPAAAHVLPTLRQGPGREQVRFEPERVEAAIARIEARAGAREAGP